MGGNLSLRREIQNAFSGGTTRTEPGPEYGPADSAGVQSRTGECPQESGSAGPGCHPDRPEERSRHRDIRRTFASAEFWRWGSANEVPPQRKSRSPRRPRREAFQEVVATSDHLWERDARYQGSTMTYLSCAPQTCRGCACATFPKWNPDSRHTSGGMRNDGSRLRNGHARLYLL